MGLVRSLERLILSDGAWSDGSQWYGNGRSAGDGAWSVDEKMGGVMIPLDPPVLNVSLCTQGINDITLQPHSSGNSIYT